LRFGHILRAALTGNRDGLSDAERRAASEGTTTAGGFLVPSPISARVFDVIRARSSILRAGSTTVPMNSRTLDLIKVTTGPTAAWLAENAAGSSADIVLSRVQLVAKTLACYAEASMELVADSDPSFSGVLETSIGGAMATELDRACLDGSGSGATPTGLYTLGSIQNISLVPAAITYSAISRGITAVMNNNFDPNAVILTTRDLGVLDRLVGSGDGQPLAPTPLCAALMPFVVSNQRSAEVGSPQDSKAAVGDFQYAVVGIRQGLMIETSNTAVTGSDSAWEKRQIHFRATLRADFQVVLPAAFCTLDFGAPA
jgi:HK97 family phage major capsid protein